MVRSRWRPRPLIAVSILLHVFALVVSLAVPGAWRCALAAIAANHALLTLATFFPNTRWLVDSKKRLPVWQKDACVALTFDDGPDPEVTPLVLNVLEQHAAGATFFCIGERAAAQPALMKEIRARGHSVGNHSLRHKPFFTLMGISAQRQELAAAETVLRETGPTSGLVRVPLGMCSPLSDWVFHSLGLQHVGWTCRGFDTQTGDAARVAARITKDVREGDIILLHDGNAALDSNGRPITVAVLESLLSTLKQRGLRSVSLDAAAVVPARAPFSEAV